MYCVRCGQKIKDGAEYCPNCGKLVSAPTSSDQKYSQRVAPVAPATANTLWACYKRFWTNWSVKGRSTLKEFWTPMLIHGIIIFPLWIAVGFYFIMTLVYGVGTSYGGTFPPHFAAQFQTVLWSLVVILAVTIVPSILVTVRRLHDSGHSGSLWLLVFCTIIGQIVLFVLVLQQPKNDNTNPWHKGVA